MGQYYIVKKVLNNNVLIAEHNEYAEVVLIGKGIGFGRKKGERLDPSLVEKVFILKDKDKQEQYKKLLPKLDDDIFDAIVDAFEFIRARTHSLLNEHIHVALTDHIFFSVQRYMKGLMIKYPFLTETKALYPKEYEIASEVVDIVNRAANIHLPEDEKGFITLHIHSALGHKKLSDINKHSRLIGQLIEIIEAELGIKIDKESLDYLRLVRHLRFTLERLNHNDHIGNSSKMSFILKEEYPICYNLAWKLIKIIQNTMKKPIGDAEAVFLTIHLQRIANKG
ncbi:glucose PTS transporter transcription antiterminator GlcT [Fervidibacillus halotolerans]|uniref:PRD domain-containing protein n=1 Tax=Fervidibacillus halotolerans TaxID=2980027 RepID=A0A9E8LZC8_9BACI|nr:PRD domain-containing protein [Fervidibacillus halotolerans]WAA12593.1 PRD domain-containing protein [Fervidibacillus halotolerans]